LHRRLPSGRPTTSGAPLSADCCLFASGTWRGAVTGRHAPPLELQRMQLTATTCSDRRRSHGSRSSLRPHDRPPRPDDGRRVCEQSLYPVEGIAPIRSDAWVVDRRSWHHRLGPHPIASSIRHPCQLQMDDWHRLPDVTWSRKERRLDASPMLHPSGGPVRHRSRPCRPRPPSSVLEKFRRFSSRSADTNDGTTGLRIDSGSI
jgi:hypothetical protein